MDEDRFFLINRGSLNERLDPVFYKPSIREFVNSLLTNKNFTAKPLHKLAVRIVDGPFGTQLKVDDYREEGVPVIRVSNVRTGEISEDKLVKIDEEKHKDIRRSRVLPDDVLLTKAGAILGYSAVFPKHLKEGNITSHLVTITCTDEILPHYLKYIFHSEIGQRQIYRWGNKSTRPELNTQEVKKIIIPVLPKEQQQKIIDSYHKAIAKRKHDERKAEELLISIDEYLLNELGITLPQQQANTIQNRMFKTNWQKVTGSRFDPKKYSKQSESLIACIADSPFRKISLKSLLTHTVSGDWGLGENENPNETYFQKCLVIRATEFDNNFNLNIENSRAKYRFISKGKLKKLDIKEKDFLLEKSGGSPDQPVGRIAILEKELLQGNTICFSNFIHKFRINEADVLPEYLFCFLKTIHNIKLTDVMQSQTSGIRNLIMREYWNQKIVLPNMPKQKKLAENIYKMRAMAKKNEMAAMRGFEKSKKEIQKMIVK